MAVAVRRPITTRRRAPAAPRKGLPMYGANAARLTAPRAPAAPRPAVAAAPTAGAPAAPTQFVPDAQYLAEQAQRQFERQQQVNLLTQQSSQDATNTQEALRRLMAEVPRSRQTISEQANRQGLFYSGQLGKRLGDYQAQVTRQQSDLTTGAAQREAAREAARQAIAQGASLEDAAQLAAAAARQVDLDTADAGQNLLAPPAVTPAPRARTVPAKPKPKPRPRARRRPVARRSGVRYGAGAARVAR